MNKAITSSGRRKRAVARATVKQGTGKVTINSTPLESQPQLAKLKIQTPLILAEELSKKVDITIKVQGGGISSQADAIALAIATAFVKQDKKLEKTFLEYDRRLLVADVRRKEVSKPNRHGRARAKRQKSYR